MGHVEASIKHEEDYVDTLKRVRNHLNLGDALLEVACGTDSTALRLAEADCSIVATHFSLVLVHIWKQRQDAAQPPANEVPSRRERPLRASAS